MTNQDVINLFSNHPATLQITQILQKGDSSNIYVKGFAGSGPTLIGGSVWEQTRKTQLFVMNDKEAAAYFTNDLQNLFGAEKVFYFPGSTRLPYREEQTDNANVLHRAEVMDTLAKRTRPVLIVTYPEALSEKVTTKKQLLENTLQLKAGDQYSIDFINEVLHEYKFEPVDFVTEPGQFSIRGGIVDVFSYANEHPFRVEFFGDEVESIRSFDAASQLSLEKFKSIRVIPNMLSKNLMKIRQNFLEFLPESTCIWLQDLSITRDLMEKEYARAVKMFDELDKSPVDKIPPGELYTGGAGIDNILSSRSVIEFGLQSYLDGASVITLRQKPQPYFNKNFEMLSEHFKEQKNNDYTSLIAFGSEKQKNRLENIFEDINEEPAFASLLLSLHEGFIDEDLKLGCYTDHQIFERFHRFKLKEGFKEAKQKISLKELTKMERGDFVVHIDHGVGRFEGLVRVENNGKMQEAIKLTYKDKDVVYVSIHSLHRISKFTGKEGYEPKVNKLGSNAWKKLKSKTKRKIKEVAFDLIKLYAKRRAAKGFAFSPDNYMQKELEASFIYEDTPDQEKATADVKADMEAEAPMDRLICGDVGFGKTEVAIRAAFKAALDGKQTAVLVPTTILALQHFKSFTSRLEDFPVTVDFVNRFKSSKKIKETLQKLKDGKVDIIIGTHRLVGKDVKFKNLGLMIIDEEQKFGVSVKDKLKTIKANVDTLTLTATPIPRTLQFSLMAARDLSVINTPPPNRQPVQTEVLPFNEEVIRDALRYELGRDGQVFFVHNRVQNIKEVAGMINRVVPDAEVVIAHGQMEGKELEEKMLKFVNGECDVLVATTIIESGLDIPNANTIIINNAHQFGLSDLHQMRGRVGRSNKKAFCYLLGPPLSVMTEDARKRLTALTQFSDLGSGFKIAMRDLDIRGAGNLLGGEQSGFISEIGFDMYQKILNEAIQELKQTEFKDLFQAAQKSYVEDTLLETDLEIMIPDTYVNNISERLLLYKELSDVNGESDLAKFKTDLKDRFGPLPDETIALIESVKLKWLGKAAGFEKIVLKGSKLICYFIPDQSSPYYETEIFQNVLAFVQRNAGQCELKQKGDKLSLVFTGVNSIDEALMLLLPLLD